MSTQTLTVESEHHDIRLDIYLTKVLPDVPSRTFVKKVIDAGRVQVNGHPQKAHYKVQDQDQVVVDINPNDFPKSDIVPEDIPLNVFYEDEDILVINKPSGMLVHPARGRYTQTLINALLHRNTELSDINSELRPGIVHRLDEDTSGLIVVAKNNRAHAILAKQFERHEVQKKYVALVSGEIEFDQGMIDAPLGRHPLHHEKRSVQFDDSAKEAVTVYEVLKRHEGITYVALYPQTGRTHQLRVHMAHLKHPILGDEKYGKKNSFPRLALHAQSIGFTHPARGVFVEFSTPAPKEFLEKVQILDRHP
jgi:23S rRNA pseudouridine1911/1915/1917 synthase